MKKILCYGDSNTFGFIPDSGKRYDKNSRWAGVLAKELENEFEVIEEGANNRNAAAKNPQGEFFCAQEHFPILLSEYREIDILILAVGTNDTQFLYDISCDEILKGIEKLVLKAKEKAKRIILIPPVRITPDILKGFFKVQFDRTSIEKIEEILEKYKNFAKKLGVEVFDFNDIAKPSKEDGLHYTKMSHVAIAKALGEYVLALHG